MNKVASHIINFYGRFHFKLLISDLQSGVPLSEIARLMGVSRQRVYQWKQALGETENRWKPYPDVMKEIDNP